MKRISITHKIFIVIIFLITFLARFVRLNMAPPSLSNDEISIAYDAYSIAHTLRDEHNHYLPLSFQSHNTYKAPLAIYATAPTVLLFGNNEYGVRLPSAILGSLTVLFLILLVFELTKNINLSLISGFVLSITPWHIYTSRMALESNIALFFLVLGLYFFFYFLNHKSNIFIIFSFISFALSIYGYHTEWGFTPLIIASIVLLNLKSVIKRPGFYIGFLIFFILITPIVLDSVKNINTNARANTEILFKDPRIESQLNNPEFNCFQKSQIIVTSVLGSYSSYINLSSLFFNGLNLFSPKDPYQVGLFLAPFLPMFIIGLFNIKKYFQKYTLFLYIWILISPLIPALTQGGANFVRNLISVIPYTIVISVGLLITIDYLRPKRFLRILSICLLLVSEIYFSFSYYYYFPKLSGENFQYGYKDVAQFISANYSSYQKIVVDPRFGDYNMYDGVPHLYLSYFTHMDPEKMLQRQENSTGMYFDKYEIRSINWNAEKIDKSSLYIVPVSNSPNSANLKILKEFQLPNGKPAFRILSSI